MIVQSYDETIKVREPRHRYGPENGRMWRVRPVFIAQEGSLKKLHFGIEECVNFQQSDQKGGHRDARRGLVNRRLTRLDEGTSESYKEVVGEFGRGGIQAMDDEKCRERNPPGRRGGAPVALAKG